jgi:hypothetical protein
MFMGTFGFKETLINWKSARSEYNIFPNQKFFSFVNRSVSTI